MNLFNIVFLFTMLGFISGCAHTTKEKCYNVIRVCENPQKIQCVPMPATICVGEE